MNYCFRKWEGIFSSVYRMNSNVSTFLRVARKVPYFARSLNCWTAAITKIHRKIYERTYPCILVQADGSTINIQYPLPRRIIVLPVNFNTLSEAERKDRLNKRKPKTKITIEEDIEDDFDEYKYVKLKQK